MNTPLGATGLTGNCVAGNWFDNSSPWFDDSSPSASWATAWATASAKQNDGEHAAGGEVSFGVQYVPYEGIEKTDYYDEAVTHGAARCTRAGMN